MIATPGGYCKIAEVIKVQFSTFCAGINGIYCTEISNIERGITQNTVGMNGIPPLNLVHVDGYKSKVHIYTATVQ